MSLEPWHAVAQITGDLDLCHRQLFSGGSEHMTRLTGNGCGMQLSDALEPASNDDWGRVTSIVPHGHDRYVRIFNPASLRGTPVAWSEVASALGITLTAATQWERDIAPAASGRDYGDPDRGEPDPVMLQALGELLLSHELEERDWQFATSTIYGADLSVPQDSLVTFPSGFEMACYAGAVRDEQGAFVLPLLGAEHFGAARLPMYFWPDTREWVVGQAPYGSSVYVACSQQLAEQLRADMRLDTIDVLPTELADFDRS